MAGSPDGMEAVIRIPKATETKAKLIIFFKKADYGVFVEDADGASIVDRNSASPFTAILYNTGSAWEVMYL